MADGGKNRLTGEAAGGRSERFRADAPPLPPGSRLLRFDEELTVDVLMGEPLAASGPVRLTEALAALDPEALETAATAALEGETTTTLRCPSSGPCSELIVRLGPDSDTPGSGLAVAFEADGHESRSAGESERADELELIALTARELARSTDADEARATTCEVTLSICSADVAVMLELDPGSETLVPTASAGLELGHGELPPPASNESSAATRALRTNVPQFVATADDEPPELAALLSACGVSSALMQPIARGRTVRAIMAVGWRWPIEAIHPRSARLMEVVSVESAVAIDRASAFSRLVSMARTDPLTGLPNRRAWEETLGRELARARRERSQLTVAMIDLDGFKAFNDARGHPAGDRLLAGVADAWQPQIRASDVLARFGGDEFALLLPHCGGEQAGELLDRLEGSPGLGIGFSAGAAAWDGEESAEALLARADRAVYRAKSAGPGRVIIDAPA